MLTDLPPSVDGDSIAYLNGEFLALKEARVSVLDRGFVFGDGVYEVIPVYRRQPFRLEGHLGRLQDSMEGIGLRNPHSAEEWDAAIRQLVRRCAHDDQSLYLQVTRGVAKRDHAFPKDTRPTVVMIASALASPSREQVAQGVQAVTAQDYRWLRCDIKSIALLPNVLLRQYAVDAGAAEVVLFRDGQLTEGSSSNIFVVKDGTLVAPPKSHLILPGITYDVVLELAHAAGLRTKVRSVSESEVRSAQEVWLTSSTREVLAITTLDGKPVGSGRPGPVFQSVYARFQELKARTAQAGAAQHA